MTSDPAEGHRSVWPSDQGRAAEVEARIAAVRTVIEDRGERAAILSSRSNVAWLTAGAATHVSQSTDRSVASVIVARDGVTALTQNIEAARLAEEELAGLRIEVIGVPWWQRDAIQAAAMRIGGARAAADDELEPALEPLRSLLSPFDRNRLAALARVAEEAAAAVLSDIDPGITEEELAARALARLPGIRVPVILVAADERIARYRHPLPGPTPVRARVMLVLVVERWGLHAAVTRILELEAPSPDLVCRSEAVREIQRRMHAATRPGATFGGVLGVARRAYEEAGFADEWQDHHQGGSIGYRARERVAVPEDETPIQTGMAFAWNPSIAGAKAEETLIVEAAATLPISRRRSADSVLP